MSCLSLPVYHYTASDAIKHQQYAYVVEWGQIILESFSEGHGDMGQSSKLTRMSKGTPSGMNKRQL